MFASVTNREIRSTVRRSSALTLLLSASALAQPQLRQWAAPLDGLWDDPANWLPMDVPDTPDEIARLQVAGDYTVTLNQSVSLAELHIVATGARLEIAAGETLEVTLSGGIMPLRGALLINPTGEDFVTELRVSRDVQLDGNGSITLNAHADNPESAAIRAPIGYGELDTGQVSVNGNGLVRANLSNRTTVNAHEPNQVLTVDGHFSNAGIASALSGGTLRFGWILQGPNAQILASGLGSRCELTRSVIWGGTISAMLGARCVYNVDVRFLGSSTLEGEHVISPGTNVFVFPPIWNNGTLTVNTAANLMPATLGGEENESFINGTGAVVLNAPPDSLAQAKLVGNIQFGEQQSLLGTGSSSLSILRMHGRASPGTDASPIGQFEFPTGLIWLQPTSRIELQLGGNAPNQFDRLTGSAIFRLDGTLAVTCVNDFIPMPGDEFAILSYGSRQGAFREISTPSLPYGRVWRVRTTNNALTLSVACFGDVDGDHAVALTDLATLLAELGEVSDATLERGDLDGDGDVDLTDLASMLAVFGATCSG